MLMGIDVIRAAMGKVYPVIWERMVTSGEELIAWIKVELLGIW